jgi:hypothetical protein
MSTRATIHGRPAGVTSRYRWPGKLRVTWDVPSSRDLALACAAGLSAEILEDLRGIDPVLLLPSRGVRRLAGIRKYAVHADKTSVQSVLAREARPRQWSRPGQTGLVAHGAAMNGMLLLRLAGLSERSTRYVSQVEPSPARAARQSQLRSVAGGVLRPGRFRRRRSGWTRWRMAG